LSEAGIIAADDVFNPVVPGVAEGLCRFMSGPVGRNFAPFATCGNKLFLTRVKSHATYVAICKTIILRDSPAHLDRAKHHLDNNATIGYAPTMFGHEVVPFVV
jgi:hypothetical protein